MVLQSTVIAVSYITQTHIQDYLNKNYCLKSIGQELESIHAVFLRLCRPHTTTDNTHTVQENLRNNPSLRSIAQELERICSAIEDIEDARLKEEKKRMDYSFYSSSSPSQSAVVSSPEEEPGDEAATPASAAAEDCESHDNDELFEEYFGSYLTYGYPHDQLQRQRHLSLHAPVAYGARRSSETPV